MQKMLLSHRLVTVSYWGPFIGPFDISKLVTYTRHAKLFIDALNFQPSTRLKQEPKPNNTIENRRNRTLGVLKYWTASFVFAAKQVKMIESSKKSEHWLYPYFINYYYYYYYAMGKKNEKTVDKKNE